MKKYATLFPALICLLLLCNVRNSSAQTALVKDIAAGTTGGLSGGSGFTIMGTNAFFVGYTAANNYELWKTDGTTAGTVMVKDINPGTGNSNPSNFTIVGATLYFLADNGTNGKELWKTDGTTAGTVMVKDINPGTSQGPYNYTYIVAMGTNVYFIATDGATGYELWKSDGTSGGTVMVKDIVAGSGTAFPGYTNYVAVIGSTLFFSASTSSTGYELWKTDGTSGGTVMVKDIYSGASTSNLQYFSVVGSTLFFTATEGTNGEELWKSDGSAGGTVMVKDIYPGASSSSTTYLYPFNGSLIFRANNGTNGHELWKSDGTSGGTSMITDIYSGSNDGYPANFFLFNSTLYFTATTSANGEELWKTDGSTAGTTMVKDINSGSSGSGCSLFTAAGSVFYFSAYTSANGTELWKSDGTTGGTAMVRDINTGTTSSGPTNLGYVNGTLFFNASAVRNGFNWGDEPWKTDGTSAGTLMVNDLNPLTGSSSPVNFFGLNGISLFAAGTPTTGQELYQITTGHYQKPYFTATDTILIANSGIANQNVTNFNDHTVNDPTSWSWSFTSGTPSTSTTQNPTNVTYSTAGSFAAGLTCTWAGGANATFNRPGYIDVYDIESVYYVPHTSTGNNGGFYISLVKVGLINNTTGTPNGTDFTHYTTPVTTFNRLNSYKMYLRAEISSTSYYNVWIDLNRDGAFTSAEKVAGPLGTNGSVVGIDSLTFTVPSGTYYGKTRMRVQLDDSYSSSNDPNSVSGNGETEDYDVTLAAPNGQPAAANFEANYTNVYTNTNINFTDLSGNNPTSWAWAFPGAGITSSTQQNPTNIYYTTPGTYNVSLTATNVIGANTATKTGYITVAAPPTYCTPTGTTNTGCYIYGFQLNTLNLGSSSGPYYVNNTYYVTDVDRGATYTVTVKSASSSFSNIKLWADYNRDGDFLDAGEQIGATQILSSYSQKTFTITIPSSAATGQTRIRLIYNNASVTMAPCMTGGDGQVMDASIYIKNAVAPVADFTASALNIPLGGTVNFFDLSDNDPTSWLWTFTGGTPASSTLKNPAYIQYNTAGCYQVVMKATNAVGNNTKTKTCYINVGAATVSPPVANFSASPTSITTGGSVNFTDLSTNTPTSWSWSFTGGTPSTSTSQNPSGITYPTAGCYQVTLTATNSAGSNQKIKTCYINVTAGSPTAPVANFSASSTNLTVGGSTNFTDLSTNSPTSWSWSFTGGTPSTSTAQNPSGITYSAAGCYQVTLTATNAAGSDPEVKTCYINVTTSTISYCAITTSATGTAEGDFIDGVTLGTINNVNTGSITGAFYNSYTSMSTNLTKSSSYTINIKSGTWPAGYPDYYAAWIDYNKDGDFADTGEKLGEFLSTAPSTTQGIAFTVPAAATTGSTRLRVRGVWATAAGIDPCLTYDYGETEDYSVNITSPGAAPVADFTSSATTIAPGGSVNFTDLSTNTPTSWSWAFTGGTPSTSTAQNPSGITYPTAGCYQVTLTATNASGSDPEVKTCYINVTSGTMGNSCDTLQNYQNSNTIVLYTNGSNGYVSGHNSFGDLAKADLFSTYTPGYLLKGAYMAFGRAKYSSTSKTINVRVWDDNGVSGAPGTVLATRAVAISSITPGAFVYVQFTSPVSVSGPFYLGIEFAYATGDTVALYSNSDGQTTPGTAWEKFNDGTWHAMSDGTATWGLNISHVIRPLLCSPATAAEELYSGLDFNVYPNPNAGEFTLEINSTETTPVTYTIINSVGKEIARKELKQAAGTSEQINLSDYASGIYYVILRNGDAITNKKIIIQK